MLYLMMFTLVVSLTLYTCAGCAPIKRITTSDIPAKQQIKTTPTHADIPVSQIDLNGDGSIDSQERHQLGSNHISVLSTFAAIVGAVVVVCVTSAWISNKSKEARHGPDDDFPPFNPPSET